MKVGNTVSYNHKWISKKYSQKTELHKLDVMQSIVLCKDDVYPIFSSLNIQEQSRLYKSQSEHFSRQIVDVILPQQEVKAMKVHEEKQKQKKIYTTMMTNVDSHPNVMIRCSYRVFSQIEGQRLIKWMKLQRFFFRLVNYCVWSFSKSCSPASIFWISLNWETHDRDFENDVSRKVERVGLKRKNFIIVMSWRPSV